MILTIAIAAHVVLWIWVCREIKKAKVEDNEEGWTSEGPGFVKWFPDKPLVIEEHEIESFHVFEDQKN